MIDALIILTKLFIVGFLVNLLWEVNHSVLYTTCYNLTLPKYTRLITLMSAKDGFWIALFYGITVLIYKNFFILEQTAQLLLFIATALLFSFFDEYISLRLKRWEYVPAMPTILGVGLTPLLEIAVTGVITFFLVFVLL